MEIAFLVFYTAILALVYPYIGLKDDRYGTLVPAAFTAIVGSISWTALIWLGLGNTNALTWIIVMLLMPLGGWVGTNQVARLRRQA
ncbi:MAG: hypothetical protein RLZZ164_854 [Actinomycetota bacterium]|jgi:hypothetical protein